MVCRTKFEWRKPVSQVFKAFPLVGSFTVLHRLRTTFTEPSVDLGQAVFSYDACQQRQGTRSELYLPFCEKLVVYGVLSYDLVVTFGPEEIAELFPSGDGFTELKVNGIWHDDCFLLNDFGQAEQVPGGN